MAGIKDANLEQVVRLLQAHRERYAVIQDIAVKLQDPVVWRAPDGELAIGSATPDDISQLSAVILAYLAEAESIATNIRALTGLDA